MWTVFRIIFAIWVINKIYKGINTISNTTLRMTLKWIYTILILVGAYILFLNLLMSSQEAVF
jgi:hypothetical protein